MVLQSYGGGGGRPREGVSRGRGPSTAFLGTGWVPLGAWQGILRRTHITLKLIANGYTAQNSKHP